MSEDYGRIVRFIVTGSFVACIYVITFTLLYNAGFDPLTTNFLAFSLSVVIQYVMQTCWTFRRPLFEGTQTLKFATVIGMGLVYSSAVASFLGPTLGWPAWVSAGSVAITLPAINYISFRLWVYRTKDADLTK